MKKTKLISLVLLSTLLSQFSEAQFGGWLKKKQKAPQKIEFTGKIWEAPRNTTLEYSSKGNTAFFKKDEYQRGSDGNDFIALVSNRVSNLPGPNDIFIEYRGACASQILIELIVRHNPLFDPFLKSGDPDDLPIHDLLDALTKGLRDQCDELESIRVRILMYDPATPHRFREFLGSSGIESDWQLIEGFSETREDYRIRFSINSIHDKYLTAEYNDLADPSPVVKIAPRFSNNSERYFYKKAKFPTPFEDIAQQFIERYRTECTWAEQITFELDHAPNGYMFLRDDERTYLASKSSDWRLDTSNLVAIGEPLIKSYTELIDYLLKGDYQTVNRHRNIFDAFYLDLLKCYGTTCIDQIKNPIKVTTYTVDQMYDNNGFKISETRRGSATVVYIEKELLSLYNNYTQKEKMYSFYQIVQTATSTNTPSSILRPIKRRIEWFKEIESYVERNQESDELKQIYDKATEFAKTHN